MSELRTKIQNEIIHLESEYEELKNTFCVSTTMEWNKLLDQISINRYRSEQLNIILHKRTGWPVALTPLSDTDLLLEYMCI